MNLRTRIIRLAHERADLREHLLPLLKQAREERGPGGLIFDYTQGFSARTIPTDPPYNQTYEGLILMNDSGTTLRLIREHKDQIGRMKTLREVVSFVNDKLKAMGRREPKWHRYSMPD